MSEEWRDIQGFEGYQVSNMGRVKSLDRCYNVKSKYGVPFQRKVKGRILKPKLSSGGNYFQVYLPHKIYKSIHRLVLESFVGPCPKGYWTRHLDGKGLNNNLGNLCWDTPKNNVADKKKHGTEHLAKIDMNTAEKIRVRYTEIKSYREVGKEFGVSYSTVRDIIKRRTWK